MLREVHTVVDLDERKRFEIGCCDENVEGSVIPIPFAYLAIRNLNRLGGRLITKLGGGDADEFE